MSNIVIPNPARCLNNEPIGLPLKPLSTFTIDLDVFVLVSLLFQFLLVIVAPWRKYSLAYLTPIIGFVYLESVSIVTYSMGLVPNKSFVGGRTNNLRVFWAPFFLLHLGNPNTISGLSLSDNELWLRYAGHLVTLSYTFGRVFLHNFFNTNQLWLPTLLIFFAGLLKYGERVICLYSARITKFRESTMPKPEPGENYARLMKTYTAFHRSAGSNQIDPAVLGFQMSRSDQVRFCNTRAEAAINSTNTIRKLSQVQIVKEAYRLFQDFRGLFVNSVYTFDKRDISRHFFLNRVADAEDAFSVCEVELNFAYDVFYTKAIFINRTKWPVVNLATLVLQLVSLVLWFRIDKCPIRTSSLYVTHTLVYGSLALDLLSLIMFFTSDWNIAMNVDAKSFFSIYFYENLLLFKKGNREMYQSGCLFPINLYGRWSERIPQMNLINSSVKKWLLSDRISTVWFTDKHRNFIFKEVVARSCWAQNPREVEDLCSARGMWVLNRFFLEYKDSSLVAETLFGPWITDVEYEESLILWHIATTLCYELEDAEEDYLCELSSTLSGYMLYILIGPLSQEITGQIIYRDTCAEAKLFFDRVLPPWKGFKVDQEKRLRSACEKMIEVNTDVVSPKQIRGNESKSVLFDACILAKKLRDLERVHGIKKWEVISGVWAEMLFFCATRSSPTDHVKMLPKGGSLLTLVWLLMAHLGLGKHFRYSKAKDTRAQLFMYGNH